ncbi:MAG: S53 family peptidase, partial [Magnetospirillum sp.]|nr:S53 family peptidase [Magnetospirillum sp.]
MPNKPYKEFTASSRVLPDGAKYIREADATEVIEISIYLKARPSTAASGTNNHTSKDPRAALHESRALQHADDIKIVTDFAISHGLTVSSVEAGRRLIKVTGPLSKLLDAFKTKVAIYHDGKREYRGRNGALSLPEDLHGIIEGVLGLDNRDAANPHFTTIQQIDPAIVTGHRPNQVGSIYAFPPSVTGIGQCIAIIELGGGYLPADTQAAFTAMGLATPNVVAVSVDGGKNKPGDPNADGEVALDIQVAGGVAPGASLAVYFAPNSTQGFVDSITQAVHDIVNKPSIISISWGTAERNWTVQGCQLMNAALQDAANLGVSVFVASGDHLGTDNIADGRAHVDFPASSPWAIGCGGTLLDTNGDAVLSEVVWNEGANGWGTGGGISDLFDTPVFQLNANLPVSVNDGRVRRGVPDVGGNGASASGYLTVLNGQTVRIGGTSAVSPLWAGLTARLNQAAERNLGFYAPTLYNNPGLLRVITRGNNKPVNSDLGYNAGPGWSACTGLGVPVGDALYNFFKAHYSPVYQQGDPGNGIGGYDLRSPADRAIAFDYDHSGKTDHIALYRPGTGTMWILKNNAGIFTPVYHQGDPGNGIGGYNLKSPADQAFAFDYDHSGKMDHIALYRPGTGTIWILKNNAGTFTPVYQQGDPGNGIGGYNLKSPADQIIAFDYEHSGKRDYLALYRPGTGTIWILKNNAGTFTPVYQQGDPGNGIGGYNLMSTADRVFAFDYAHSGNSDHLALYRPGTGTIWILKNNAGTFTPV